MTSTTSLARYRARRLADRLVSAAAGPDPAVGWLHDAVEIVGPVTVEGVTSGDGRRIEAGAVWWDNDPVPILWDRVDGDHTGQTVGAYTSLARNGVGEIVGKGTLGPTNDPDTAAAIARIVELIGDRSIGQSVMLDSVDGRQEAVAVRDDGDVDGGGSWRHDDVVHVVESARVRHVALLDTPAFAECRPELAAAAVAAASADTAVRALPAAHFARWDSKDPVPFTVDEDGRVWGHAAGTGCHRSPGPACLLYTGDVDPAMDGFHTSGMVTLDDGTTIRVGPVTFGGLHADTSMSRDQRRVHHEAGSTVVALVRAWDDVRGRLSVAGTLVGGLDPTTVDQIRGCSPSYERWPERGGLTLVGLHLVPMPAHPVATAAAAGGPQIGVDCMCGGQCVRCGR